MCFKTPRDLGQALEKVELTDARHFLRLAAVQIRREMIDMARHYHGPHGMAAHHVTNMPLRDAGSRQAPLFERAEATLDPQRVSECPNRRTNRSPPRTTA